MYKKILSAILAALMAFNLAGCGKKAEDFDVRGKDFSEIAKAAKGSTVNFYGWGGSDQINSWIQGYPSQKLKEKYNISVNRVGMNIDEILNKLLSEKQLNVEKGNIDVVWINGENFFTARENGLLFGPFVGTLPNFNKYLDKESPDVKYDFGHPTEGFEAPFGKAQFVMIYDSEKLVNPPRDYRELLELAKKHPGKLTYPAPPDFTGSAFVRNIICDIVGYEQFMTMEADEETVRKAIAPAMDYLKELKPYLWKEGRTYPAELPILDNMYSDGEVLMTMDYNPNSASGKIEKGIFKGSTKTFLFEKGTLGNTHFLAIPFNAPNKAGAMAFINEILSVETQASKYEPATWGDLPVLDNNRLSAEEKSMLSQVKQGAATISQDELMKKRVPEMPAKLVPIIEKIWMETIPGSGK